MTAVVSGRGRGGQSHPHSGRNIQRPQHQQQLNSAQPTGSFQGRHQACAGHTSTVLRGQGLQLRRQLPRRPPRHPPRQASLPQRSTIRCPFLSRHRRYRCSAAPPTAPLVAKWVFVIVYPPESAWWWWRDELQRILYFLSIVPTFVNDVAFFLFLNPV